MKKVFLWIIVRTRTEQSCIYLSFVSIQKRTNKLIKNWNIAYIHKAVSFTSQFSIIVLETTESMTAFYFLLHWSNLRLRNSTNEHLITYISRKYEDLRGQRWSDQGNISKSLETGAPPVLYITKIPRGQSDFLSLSSQYLSFYSSEDET